MLNLSRLRRRRRAGEWTQDKAVTFIVTLAASRSVTLAAARAGMSRKSAYALKVRDPAFAAAWDAAIVAHAFKSQEGGKTHKTHNPPVGRLQGDEAALRTSRKFDAEMRDLFFRGPRESGRGNRAAVACPRPRPPLTARLMCARRFLIVIFILTLLVVAGGFAIYQWGGELLLRQATPKGHFEAAEAGSGPDYKDIKNWADWPDPVHGSNYLWLPGGRFEPEGKKPAATFYVHPTTYLERDRWNAPLLPPGEPFHIGENLNWAERITLFVQSQASAFNNVSEVWTPRYRQAAFGAFLLTSDDANKALDLAYGDVRAAFDEFLRIQPADKPIILAGHSQGALHLMRLIEERKARLNGRLVAAYVVGWPIDTSADLPALGFPACRAPEETGCILSWMSFGEPANPSLILGEWEKTRGPSGIEHEHERVLCVNPLSGTEGGNVPPQANPGTLVPTADLSSATLESGLVGANCRKGLLMLEGAIPAMGPYVLPGNNYHVYDYALFWAAVRNDAARRLASWRR